MGSNKIGASPKQLLPPFNATGEKVCNALYSVVKDNVNGFVRRKLNECKSDLDSEPPIVTVYSDDSYLLKQIEALRINVKLQRATFPLRVVDESQWD